MDDHNTFRSRGRGRGQFRGGQSKGNSINDRLGGSENHSMSDGEQPNTGYSRRSRPFNNPPRGFRNSRGRGRGNTNIHNGMELDEMMVQPKFINSSTKTISVYNCPEGDPNTLIKFLQRKASKPINPRNTKVEGNETTFNLTTNEEVLATLSLSGIICGGCKLIIKNKTPTQQNIMKPHTHNNKISKLLAQLIQKRYNHNINFMDLSSLKEDSITIENSLFFNFKTFKLIMQIVQEEYPKITTMSISNNGIVSLGFFEDLIMIGENTIRSLDISNNKITDINELRYIKTFKIKELITLNNPLRDNIVAQNGEDTYKQKIIQLIPSLQSLDGIPLNNTATQQQPLVTNIPHHFDTEKLVHEFILNFFNTFDNNRSHLTNMYIQNSIFSYHTSSQNNALFPDTQTIDVEKNLFEPKIAYGQSEIINRFLIIPKTNHQISSHNTTTDFVSVNENNNSQEILIEVNSQLTTNNNDNTTTWWFTRIFNLAVNKINPLEFYILNDMLNIYPVSQQTLNTPSYSNDTEKHLLIQKLQEDTNLTYDFAAKCLDDNNWEYTKAYYVFDQLKKKNMVPPHAFKN